MCSSQTKKIQLACLFANFTDSQLMSIKSVFLVSLLIFQACFSGYATASNASATSESKKILIVGDSLSAGYGIEVKDSWPALMQQQLLQENLSYKIHNASISGQTSAEGVAQIDRLLSLAKPSLVVLELGANDGLRGLSIKAMQKNLQTMITKSQQAGAKVLLVGIRTPVNYGRRYGEMFEASFQELAKKNNLELIPFMLQPLANIVTEDNRKDYIQGDGLHPTAKAQPLIMNFIYPKVKKLL